MNAGPIARTWVASVGAPATAWTVRTGARGVATRHQDDGLAGRTGGDHCGERCRIAVGDQQAVAGRGRPLGERQVGERVGGRGGRGRLWSVWTSGSSGRWSRRWSGQWSGSGPTWLDPVGAGVGVLVGSPCGATATGPRRAGPGGHGPRRRPTPRRRSSTGTEAPPTSPGRGPRRRGVRPRRPRGPQRRDLRPRAPRRRRAAAPRSATPPPPASGRRRGVAGRSAAGRRAVCRSAAWSPRSAGRRSFRACARRTSSSGAPSATAAEPASSWASTIVGRGEDHDRCAVTNISRLAATSESVEPSTVVGAARQAKHGQRCGARQ